MDTLLINGDFKKDTRGMLISVYSEQEILQRALIRLAVKKGSFIYDKDLGSELHKLKRSDIKLLNRTALGYVQDALYPMNELSVNDVSCNYYQDMDRVLVNVDLSIKNKGYLLEVTA